MAKKKFYVIWEGRQKGIFEDWPTAQAAVAGHKGAKFKGFESRALAEQAFSQPPENSIAARSPTKSSSKSTSKKRVPFELDKNFDVHIFSDGGCDPNPGPAASGVIVYRAGELQEKYYGGYHQGTNNTAELKALFEAMKLAREMLKSGTTVQILSDSSYSVKAMTQWAAGWQRKNWTRGKGEVLANAELIKTMYECYVQLPESLSIIHVKGHSGVEGNELADRMCFIAMRDKVADFLQYQGLESIDELLALTTD